MASIAVDVDSTLYDFETPFRQAFIDLAMETGNKDYFRGAYQSWVEWRSPADVCGMEAFEAALAKVHSPEIILAQEAYEGAQETLDQCVEAGHDLLYITNRREEVTDATAQWLMIQGFPAGDLICTMENKQDYVWDCQYIIDDRPKTLVEFVYAKWTDVPRKGFGLMFNHNRALTDIPNVFLAPTWAGLRYYLQREGVLEDARDRCASR